MKEKIGTLVFDSYKQSSAATQLRCGGKYDLYFVGNFMRFPAVTKWKNLLNLIKLQLISD